MNAPPKSGGPITQLFGLAEDHVQLALLEASYERQGLKRAFGYLILMACTLLSAVALLHVAVLAGFIALGLKVWQAALGLAVVEGIVCLAAWLLFKRRAWRSDMFQGTREELQRTFQWIHQHLN